MSEDWDDELREMGIRRITSQDQRIERAAKELERVEEERDRAIDQLEAAQMAAVRLGDLNDAIKDLRWNLEIQTDEQRAQGTEQANQTRKSINIALWSLVLVALTLLATVLLPFLTAG